VSVPSSRPPTPGRHAAEPVGVAGPILIGGLSHTGKTELRIALGAHPHVAMTRGTGMWTNHYGRYGDLARPRNAVRCIAALARDPGVRALGTDIRRLRRDLDLGPATYTRLFALIHEQHAQRQGALRWGEQLRGVEYHADTIFAGWPDARMIHMVGDPRHRLGGMSGVRSSVGKLGWETGRWVTSVELAARNALRHRDRYLVIRYEDLLERPASVLRHVSAFLRLDPDDEMLHALQTTSALIDSARRRLTGVRQDLFVRAFVERCCKGELRALGYGSATPKPALPRTGVRQVVNRAAMGVHRGWARHRCATDVGPSRVRALSDAFGDPLRQALFVEGEK
jgi:hypothetical protein